MTAHPIDTEEARFGAEAHLRYGGGGDDLAENVLALLDALAAAEHRATRAEAQSAIRGRAVAIYQQRARTAEAERDAALGYISELETAVQSRNDVIKHRDARIKAVRELHSESRVIPGTPVFGCAECGEPNETEPCATIRALDA